MNLFIHIQSCSFFNAMSYSYATVQRRQIRFVLLHTDFAFRFFFEAKLVDNNAQNAQYKDGPIRWRIWSKEMLQIGPIYGAK